jgi:sec-independent protein translocase protein TatB
MEFVVLAIVGIVVLGPDRLPGFARDAARLIRTLRDTATGAREQLRDELGPEFADLDLRNLNPRTAVQRAVFGDDVPDLRKYSPSAMVRDALFADPHADADGDSERRREAGAHVEADVSGPRPRPRPRPGPGSGDRPSPRSAAYDDDAT